MEHPKIIFEIPVKERATDAMKITDVLSRFGCNIKTRIGLHEAEGNRCRTAGIILLEMAGSME